MLTIVSRAKVDPAAWDQFVLDHPDGYFWHGSRWIAYSLAYCPTAVDLSFAVCDGDSLMAVVPLCLEPGGLLLGGVPTPAPLCSPSGQAAAWVWIGREQLRLSQASPCRAAFRSQPGHPFGWMPPTWASADWDSFVVDLTRPEPARWCDVRRSYHSLIHRAQEQHLIDVPSIGIHDARDLHRQAAGRETRSAETWEMMADWEAAGDAFTVLARNSDGDPVGYAYVIAWKRWGYYASGATLKPNLAHALQWAAMQEAAVRGVTSYEVGWDVRPGDDEKARAIAHFKAGFGGDRLRITAIQTGGGA